MVKNSISILFLVFTVVLLSCIMANAVMAEDLVITETLNIAEARRNMDGPGYSWANRFDELTLSGINLYTDSPYGLRLPDNCTVILNGNNYIHAEKYGIACSGTVVFKGTGTLTIDAGEMGIFLVTQNNTHKVRLLEGEYHITSGKYGIYSENADFSFVGSQMDIKIKSDDGFSVYGRNINLIGGTLKADKPIYTTNELVVDSINIEAGTADNIRPALFSERTLRVENIKFDGIEKYTNQSYVNGNAETRFFKYSLIFGNPVPAYVDYLIIAIAILIVALLIIIPLRVKAGKSKKIQQRLIEEGIIKK